jgi:hypothetical protein
MCTGQRADVLEHCNYCEEKLCVGQSFMGGAGVRKVEGAGVEAHVAGDRCQLGVRCDSQVRGVTCKLQTAGRNGFADEVRDGRML